LILPQQPDASYTLCLFDCANKSASLQWKHKKSTEAPFAVSVPDNF
jgi:hypothetical protein